MDDIRFQTGIPEGSRRAAAELYDEAFSAKLRAAIRDTAGRIGVLEAGLDLARGCAAFEGHELVGIAGFHDGENSLTGGITFSLLRTRLGLWRAIRALAVFSLLDRKPQPGELLMDGIVVTSRARGRGIGSALFAMLEAYCENRGIDRIRLDVVDTNPAARRLYERLGFRSIKTERLRLLRPIMGFGASTSMLKVLHDAHSTD